MSDLMSRPSTVAVPKIQCMTMLMMIDKALQLGTCNASLAFPTQSLEVHDVQQMPVTCVKG